MIQNLLPLTLVTNKGPNSISQYLKFVSECIDSGVKSVQLREKSLSQSDLFQFALSLKKLLDEKSTPLIINDNVELCLQIDAAGVHLGQSDLNVKSARNLLGKDKLIGLSVNTIDQAKTSNVLPIDYIGVGAIFPTSNKTDIETIWGTSGLCLVSNSTLHPIIAIGGIDEDNAEEVFRSGAQGVAAIGTFHKCRDIPQVVKNLLLSHKRGYS